MAELSAAQRAFLERPLMGIVTTLRSDGSPHMTVVWIDHQNGQVSFNTALGRRKLAELERDPRVSLLVFDPEEPYCWLALGGTAETTTEGADEQLDRLAKKYLEVETYPWRVESERRVTVRMHLSRVESYAFAPANADADARRRRGAASDSGDRSE